MGARGQNAGRRDALAGAGAVAFRFSPMARHTLHMLRTLLAALLVLTLSSFVRADAVTVTTQGKAFERCYRDTQIDAQQADGIVRLAPTDIINPLLGNKVKKVSFGKGVKGKKLFELGDARSAGATIYFFNGAGEATLNGRTLEVKPAGHGGWTMAEIDPVSLRAGVNEIVFTKGFSLAMDLQSPKPATSMVSKDDGATWEPADGDFLVHVRLKRFPAVGVIASEVIDLANPEDKTIVSPRLDVKSLQLVADAQTPEGTTLALEARSGPTVRPDAAWSNWDAAGKVKPARFVQWRATLRTTDPTKSPLLKAVRVEAETARFAGDKSGETPITVTESDNPSVVRSGYEFTFQPPSEKLARLRRDFKIDDVVAAGKDDYEKMILLRNWVRRQWPHNDAGSGIRTWDAIEILSAPAGKHGMCVHYSVTFTQCALSLGYNSRQVILGAHYISEVWSTKERKWYVIDVEAVQRELFMNQGTCVYLDKATRVPMSTLEIHRALAEGKVDRIAQVGVVDEGDAKHKPFERVLGEEGYGIFKRFAMPPRNNYLDQLEPWETAHGEDHYHSDGYLWWRDSAQPATPEYSWETSREGDVQWTLEHARIHLTRTAKADELEVTLDTVTPNFRSFLYRIDGGAWRELSAEAKAPGAPALPNAAGGAAGFHAAPDAHQRQVTLSWPLRAGANRFEVKPVNLLNKEGSITSVTVKR